MTETNVQRFELTLDRLFKIVALPDPEIRNAQITLAYSEMSTLVDEIIHVGAQSEPRDDVSNANWFTVATWAVATIGPNIRSRELPRRAEQLVPGAVRAQVEPWILSLRSGAGRRVASALEQGQVSVFMSTMIYGIWFVEDFVEKTLAEAEKPQTDWPLMERKLRIASRRLTECEALAEIFAADPAAAAAAAAAATVAAIQVDPEQANLEAAAKAIGEQGAEAAMAASRAANAVATAKKSSAAAEVACADKDAKAKKADKAVAGVAGKVATKKVKAAAQAAQDEADAATLAADKCLTASEVDAEEAAEARKVLVKVARKKLPLHHLTTMLSAFVKDGTPPDEETYPDEALVADLVAEMKVNFNTLPTANVLDLTSFLQGLRSPEAVRMTLRLLDVSVDKDKARRISFLLDQLFSYQGGSYLRDLEAAFAAYRRAAALWKWSDELSNGGPEDPPDGYSILEEEARSETQADLAHTLACGEVLRGNLIITAVEQVLLDPAVTIVVEHVPRMIADGAEKNASVWLEKVLRIPRTLGRLGAERRFRGGNDFIRESWARVLTDQVLVLSLPTELLRVGRDIPIVQSDGHFYPTRLRRLWHDTPPEQVQDSPADKFSTNALFDMFDRSRGDGWGTGAWDWRRFDERMNFAANLFRSRQQDRSLFWQPYNEEDRQRVANGQVPVRFADPATQNVVPTAWDALTGAGQ